jgi:hypothetical protein
MAELSYPEKIVIEDILEMRGGYVLDFTDRTFRDFVGSITKVDISLAKYSEGNSGSKANRLRSFIKLENDYILGSLLKELHAYVIRKDAKEGKLRAGGYYDDFKKAYERLLSGQIIEHIDAIQAINDDKDFHQLAKLIRESIEKNEPEAALDRLHTFLFKFLKELCDSHGVAYTKDESVNAIYGKYIKAIKEKGLIESDMAEKIIQSTFQVIQAFNDIRNNRSFAHDNPVLNYDESIFIFSNVTALVKYIQTLELKHKNMSIAEAKPDWTVEF